MDSYFPSSHLCKISDAAITGDRILGVQVEKEDPKIHQGLCHSGFNNRSHPYKYLCDDFELLG